MTNYIMNGVYGNFTKHGDSLRHKYPVQFTSFSVGKVETQDSLRDIQEAFEDKIQASYEAKE